MKTIYDLVRHRSTLEVICTNCTNTGMLNHRFLVRRFGGRKLLSEIDFVCHRCRASRYRVRVVSDHLGETRPLEAQWFAGSYDKFLD